MFFFIDQTSLPDLLKNLSHMNINLTDDKVVYMINLIVNLSRKCGTLLIKLEKLLNIKNMQFNLF